MSNGYRPVSPRRRSSVGSRLFLPLLVVGVLFMGLVVYAFVSGNLRVSLDDGLAFSFGREAQASTSTALPYGTVAVFACPRRLPAYTRITREHLLTAEGLHTVPVVQEAIEANGLFAADVDGLKGLLGRVLKRDKPVNFAFTEKDFLPVGTRAGTSAGIPPGKRGIWLDVERVHGLSGARAGDYVDLIAAKEMEPASAPDLRSLGNLTDPVMRARMQRAAATRSKKRETRSWVVARQALVVTPVRSREIKTGGARKQPKTVEEAFVAMDPEEVGRFSRAMAQDVALVAAPRSGQPEDQPKEIEDFVPPDPNAELRKMLLGEDDGSTSTFGVVEVIRGDSRKTVTVPRPRKAKPVEASGTKAGK